MKVAMGNIFPQCMYSRYGPTPHINIFKVPEMGGSNCFLASISLRITYMLQKQYNNIDDFVGSFRNVHVYQYKNPYLFG